MGKIWWEFWGPTHLIVPRSPIPSPDVNDRPTDAMAGDQTKAISSTVGMPHITMSTSLSVRVRRLSRPRRLGAGRPGSSSATTVMDDPAGNLRREDRLLLVLDLLLQARDVVRVLDEVLQRRDHHG